MSGRGVFLLKSPPGALPLQTEIYIPDGSPARGFTLLVDGKTVAEERFPAPGKYTIRSKAAQKPEGPIATVTLQADQEFSPPNDGRKLSVILTGVGFRE